MDQRISIFKKHLVPLLCSSFLIYDLITFCVVYNTDPREEQLIKEGNEEEREIHYIACTIEPKSNLLTIFDPSADNQGNSYWNILPSLEKELITILSSSSVKKSWKLEKEHPVIMCQNQVEEDFFCQTWTLHYLEQRILGKTHKEIISEYNKLKKEECLPFIETYSKQLLQKYKHLYNYFQKQIQ